MGCVEGPMLARHLAEASRSKTGAISDLEGRSGGTAGSCAEVAHLREKQ